jgi:hypothetical protein
MLVSVFAHIFVPLIALVAVAVIQFDKSIPMPAQIAEGGMRVAMVNPTSRKRREKWGTPC